MYNKQLTVSDLDYTGGLHIDIASEEDIDEEYKDIWYTKEQALDKLRRGHFLFFHSPGLKPLPFRRTALACFAFKISNIEQ